MLFLPSHNTDYRILAIDPGTTTLGVALMVVDLTTGLKRIELAYTLNAAKALHRYQNAIETQGERHARLLAHYNSLVRIMQEWKVNAVVSESPYLGRFPQSYAALLECLAMIERAVADYDCYMRLETIDPASVKVAVKVGGKNGDKTLMQKAVLGLTDIAWNPMINREMLDEHSIDSIAVGYARIAQLFNQ